MSSAMQGKGEADKLPKGEALANHLEAATLSVRNAYCECPSYDLLVPALLQHGTRDLLSHVHFVAGTPVKAMLARPTNGVSEVLDKFADCEFTCEYKYDGERAQVNPLSALPVPSDRPLLGPLK
jgi:DNA ligase 1